jgi:hypothetical protein
MERHIFLSVDIGKSAHYAVGVDQVGKTVHWTCPAPVDSEWL